jgi:GTPase
LLPVIIAIMLIDEIEVIFKGGDGGNGKVSFGKMAKSGPDGGNGGNGGDLYLEASSDLTLLNQFSAKNKFQAEDGIPGGSDKMSGHNGSDIVIFIPTGTNIKDLDSREQWNLEKNHERICLCRGGRGGRGNWVFRGPTNTTPMYAQSGEKGKTRHLLLTLKYIADLGLIGLPNAGKSSLLKELTNANPKIANYAFTTVSPNLGVMEDGKIISDIPGLIEGAHIGKGLGIKFLKHIEKARLLLHCLSAESKDLLKDYEAVRNELGSYNKLLLEKEEIILLTKSDLVTPEELKIKIEELSKLKKTVIPLSIHDYESLEALKKALSE